MVVVLCCVRLSCVVRHVCACMRVCCFVLLSSLQEAQEANDRRAMQLARKAARRERELKRRTAPAAALARFLPSS